MDAVCLRSTPGSEHSRIRVLARFYLAAIVLFWYLCFVKVLCLLYQVTANLKGTVDGYLRDWFDEIRYCIGFPAKAELPSGITLRLYFFEARFHSGFLVFDIFRLYKGAYSRG